MSMSKPKGFLALLLSGIIFGSFGIWIRLLNQELTAYQQIFLRNLIGFLLAATIVIILKQKWSLRGVKPIYVFLYATLFPIAIIFFVFAMLNTRISTAIFAFYASSLLSSLIIGRIFFNDKMSGPKVFSLVLAFLGLGILSYPFSLSTFNWGFVFGVIAGFFDTATNGFRRLLSGKIDRFVLVATQMLGGVIISIILINLVKQSVLVPISSFTLVIATIFGLLLMSVSFLTLVGFKNFDLNLGTIVISSELVFATIFAALIFKEYPTAKDLIGGLFIAAGIIVSNLKLLKSYK